MKFLYSDEPIIACSTSTLGNAAMAVIRISGFDKLSDFSSFFSLKLDSIDPRKVYYTTLVHKGDQIDDIVLTFFQAPRSYNGENILELSVHGNTLNVEKILNLFVQEGRCRLAQPGEFTYRALKNKKLTLSQVEGLDLFLNANSGYALDQGLSLLSGNLHEIYHELWELFLKHKASLELSIDFAEDIGEEEARKQYLGTLEEFRKKFQQLEKRVAPMEINLLQPEIVVAGIPNSGKSSFFNALLSEERAIVSSIAGTTRDYLTEILQIAGVKYKLIDTAGIREAKDSIESEGIKRSHKKIKESFFSVLLINPFELSGVEELLRNKFDVIYLTHSDLANFEAARDQCLKILPKIGSMGAISLIGRDQSWQDSFQQTVNKKYLEAVSRQPMLLDRHKSLISQALTLLNNYCLLAQNENDVAILSSELNSMGHCISELIGIVSPDQILNSIFTNFCIGK
jgi:tRNA modification GTPase